MFDLNLIEGVYNKFGNEIERIYNNRNEIIWELDDGSNDYLWVEPDESMIGTGSNYIGFFERTEKTDVALEENSVQYSYDGINWEYIPYGLSPEHNTLIIDKKTYFRYVNNKHIRHRIYGIHIDENSKSSHLKCNVGGSIRKYMNGVYYNIFEGYTNIPFFIGIDIIDASKLHVDFFENNNVTSYGYARMFKSQEFMKYAPVLHITTIEDYGCSEMFMFCKSLLNSPELHATTLANYCYNSMFYGCISLLKAPELPATTLAEGCYYEMFYTCTSLVNAPELPATTLAERCYMLMFYRCYSLVTAPALPATILAKACYSNMFSECTLVTAPSLPATTLADNCYIQMFEDCTSLVNAPLLPATTLAEGCYKYMFNGCTSLVNAPELPATILVTYCYNNMFERCSSLSNITCYAENTTTGLVNWVKGVSANGVFNKRRGVEWPTGVNGIPENWTVNEIDMPN